MIFETDRLLARQLIEEDFPAFHEMQSNPNVMEYTSGTARDISENRKEFDKCRAAYAKDGNDFWIWAIERKSNAAFIGTCAIVENNEIGYRFLEKFWGHGFGQEIANGLIDFALNSGVFKNIYAMVEPENTASVKILENSNLKFIKQYFDDDEGCEVRLYKNV